jgi:hypothetical protein
LGKIELQTLNLGVFATINILNNKGLNPETQIIVHHVTNVDIIKVFGGSQIL